MSRTDPIILVGIAGLITGISLSVGYIRDLYFGLKSKQWPKTQGRVIEWGMDAGAQVGQSDNAALVGYEYEVGGVKYTSRRLDYAGRGAGIGVSAVLARYSDGEVVNVRYDPSKPTRALLEPGIGLGNFLRLLCGLVVIAVGALFFLAS